MLINLLCKIKDLRSKKKERKENKRRRKEQRRSTKTTRKQLNGNKYISIHNYMGYLDESE